MVYEGFLSVDEYGCLTCDDLYLIQQIEDDFKVGDKVFVRYFLSDKKITENQAKQALLLKTFGGSIEELDFELVAYSEYTIEDYSEDLKIGGHDLFAELQNSEGDYLMLIIEKI